MTRYTLNLRFVLTLAAVTAVAAAAVWFAHRSQAGKQAVLYLARADALERDGDRPAAVEYLRRYLALRPSDTATRERFGLLLADTATDAEGLFRALLVLDQAIRDNPARHDLRRRAAAVGLFLGSDTRPGAIDHYTELLKHYPDDAGLYYGRGNCHELGENFPPAADDYRAVMRHDPTHAAAAGRLAGLLRGRLAKPGDADDVIKTLVEHAPRAAAAQLTAAVYWREVARVGTPGERPAAERKHAASAAAALELDPGDPAIVQVAADLSLSRCQEAKRRHDKAAEEAAAAEAVRILEHGIAAARMPSAATTLEERVEAERVRGRVAKLYQTRAVIALTARQYDEAERWVTRGLDVIPDAAGLNGLLAEVYTQAGRLDKAEAQIARLRDLRHPDAAVGYRQARVHAARGEWLNAVRACEAALPELTATSDLSREVQFFLAECFEQVGQPDRRQAALREAVPADPADPLWVPARAKLADALLELGRLSEAARTLEGLAARYPDANTPLARLLLAEQRRRPAAVRDFSGVEAALKAAPPSAERDLLRIDLKYATGEPPEAEKLRGELEAVRDEYPDAAEPYLALAVVELQANDPEAAARWLDAGERNPKVGDRVAFRLRRASLPTTSPADLPKLVAGADRFQPGEQVRLLIGLADVATHKQADAVADQLLEQAAEAAPASLGVRLARFERAVRTDPAKAERLLAEISQLDEPGSTSAKVAEALLLVRGAEGRPAGAGRARDLQRAVSLLDEAEPLRPGWNCIPLARAAARDLQGDAAGAITAYRRAVELGVRDADAIRRLTELLAAAGRYTEVNDLLRDLPDSGGQLAAEAALAARDFTRAAALAGRAVPDDSRDADALVWLGRVRFLGGDAAGAEKPLRRAVEVAADRPAPWVALVGLLVGSDRRAEAEEVIADAGKRVNAADRPAVLAACYEAVGRPDRAADVYRALAADRPNDPAVLREAGRYALRAGRVAEAAEVLRRALAAAGQSEADRTATRRLLAISLASHRDHRTVAEALRVFGDPAASGESTDGVRARAIVLAAQPDRKQRAEAAALLEQMEAHTALTPDEHFLLAQLYVGQDDRGKARRRFTAAVNARPGDPTFLATYARWLLAAGDAATARPLVEKLRAVAAADSLPAVELTARLAVADGKADEAADLLLRHADEHPAFVLTQMEQLGLGEKAEPVVRKLADAAGGPGGVVLRAEFLGRRGRVADAVALLHESRAALAPAALAAAAVHVLYGGRRTGADDPRADELVADAARRAADDPKVLIQRAMLADLRGRYEEAEGLLRRVLAGRPAPADLALAANNLAFLLSARSGKHDDALTLLRQAREAVGPSPDLSDTEGLVLLAKQDRTAAVEAFADSLSAGGGPVVRYHLAAAHHAGGDKLRAAADWAVALRGGLTQLDLHPLERPGYERLKGALGR